MKHLLLIDPLEKLVIKKDSTLLLALTLKKKGHDVYLLFEKDFYLTNNDSLKLNCYQFSGEFNESFYLTEFNVENEVLIDVNEDCIFHMRLDPPFDTKYLRVLWMLETIKTSFKSKVVNDSKGILLNNEKLKAFTSKSALKTYIGASESGVVSYLQEMKDQGVVDYIFKPLDLYQGIGVSKVKFEDIEQIKKVFNEKCSEFAGPVVVQPFVHEISEGEIRTIYYQGKEIGTILKVPQKGEFLANIAQGATYGAHELSKELKDECAKICNDLAQDGVDLVAFDILNQHISEVNVTCPGLLVEVSSAMKRNLAEDITNSFSI